MEEFYRRWLNIQQQTSSKQKQQKSSNQEQASRPISPDNASDIVYETPELKLIVQKGFHKKQKMFRLQDHLYYIKIVPKKEQLPMLSSILDFLHSGFLHILDQIKHFYAPQDHNIIFMTLTQSPMVNGLCTGGYDLQSPDAAAEMTDRMLSMLWQYLLSNQSLVLNDSFQVYLKILSVDHMKFSQNNPKR